MKQFKIKHTRYVVPLEYQSTPEYIEAVSRIKLWKQNGNNSQYLDLSRLNYLKWSPSLPTSLKYLFCHNNRLTSLPKLPNSLLELYCHNNRLTSLSKLPNSLEELYCSNNKLTSLPDLPNSLEELCCGNNPFTSFPSLPLSLLRNFEIKFTPQYDD